MNRGSAELATITAVILAGGFGTRLRSVVADRPKVLAEVAGRPFLAHLLDKLRDAGVRDVILSTGYLADQVEACFGTSFAEIALRYSRETTPLGTAGALRLALQRIASDQILVLNGDSYCTVDLSAFARSHWARAAAASLALARVSDTARYGRVELDDFGGIVRFEEKGAASGAGWINAGVYLIDHQRLLSIPRDRSVSLEREVFPSWVGSGLYGYRSDAALLDIGTPESYADAAAFLTRQGHAA